MYKKAEGNFWTTEELDLSKDNRDFTSKMNDNERYFVENRLAFAASDGIVNENLVEKIVMMLSHYYVLYGFQIVCYGKYSTKHIHF